MAHVTPDYSRGVGAGRDTAAARVPTAGRIMGHGVDNPACARIPPTDPGGRPAGAGHDRASRRSRGRPVPRRDRRDRARRPLSFRRQRRGLVQESPARDAAGKRGGVRGGREVRPRPRTDGGRRLRATARARRGRGGCHQRRAVALPADRRLRTRLRLRAERVKPAVCERERRGRIQRRRCCRRHARQHRAGTGSGQSVDARDRRLRSPERPADDVSQWRESGAGGGCRHHRGAGRRPGVRRCGPALPRPLAG